jgi:hypothetical protein
MAGTLSLDLTKEKGIDLGEKANSIVSNISDAFSNAVKKGTESIKFPDGFAEKVRTGFEKIDLKEIGNSAALSALKTGMNNLGMKTSTFNNLKDIFDAVRSGDLKKGLSSGLNVAISALKVPSTIKNLIKDGKNIILEKTFEDELKTIMKKQQNTISRIDKKCIQMEEAFKNNDTKTLEKTYKSLKNDLEKVMPIQNVILKGNSMVNRYELYKNKGNVALTPDEIELCNKV